MRLRRTIGRKPAKARLGKTTKPKQRSTSNVPLLNNPPVADLQNQVNALTSSSGTRQQQTATSKVLQIISTSPGDLQSVFATTLENAVRICDAKFGVIFRFDGEAFFLRRTSVRHRVTLKI